MVRATKKQSAIDAFLALPDDEKERQVAEFDKEFVAETFAPLTPAQRRAWKRIQGKGADAPKRREARLISVPVDVKLLDKADDYARARGLCRAEVVEMALRALVTPPASAKRRNGKA